MFKSYLRKLGGRLLKKILKFSVIAVIALITWETVVKENNQERGQKLYEHASKTYKEVYDTDSVSPYNIRSDGSYIYVYQK